MSLWVLTDIFGDQPALQQSLDSLTEAYQVIQPYACQMPAFADEQAAYQAFLAAGGMAAYHHKLHLLLQQSSTDVTLLGFSAGASAAWVCAAEKQLPIKAVLGLYGGQIRDYAELQPKCPVSLLFCQQEPHFSMPQLLAQLQGKANLSVRTVGQPHGFVNPLSANYQAQAATEFWSFARSWLGEADQ